MTSKLKKQLRHLDELKRAIEREQSKKDGADGGGDIQGIILVIALAVAGLLAGYAIGATDTAEAYSKYHLCVADGISSQLCKEIYL